MNKRLVDIISLSVVGVIVGGIAIANMLQPNRPTVSQAENRELAKMPDFSVESLADGTYFSGVSTYVSDTFVARDKLVTLSKKLDTLKGIDYKIDGADSFVLLDASGKKTENSDEPENSDADDILKAAFDNLNAKNKEENSADNTGKAPSWGSETGETGKTPSFAVDFEGITESDDKTKQDSNMEPDENSEPNEDSEPNENSEPDINKDNTEDTSKADSSEPKETDAETAPQNETTPAETDKSDEPIDPFETDTAAETEPAEEFYVRGLSLSKSEIKLTVGSGAVIYAYLDTNMPNPGNVNWSTSNKEVASISVNPNGGIDVKGISDGTCTVTCKYGEQFTAVCEVTVNSITSVTQTQNEPHADFLTDGMFIYGDAVHTQAFYSETNSKYYAQTAAYYKSLFGENTRMNVVVAPVSSIVVDNPEVTSKIPNQKDILDKMAGLMDESINFVDTYTPVYEHRDEYLYFKSDHHWTQRGAYYAYTAFAESVGLTPTPLDEFDYIIRNESYSGSMYMYTQDARVKGFKDVIEAFVSRKPHTMTVTGANGTVYNYDSSVVSTNNTYVTFIAGDNPYTVINVPENPQDFNVLVLKDSFGNAFVPFLCEHYGNIIVVDTRYSTFNIYDQLKDYGISDIIFVNNIQAANSYLWSKMYLSAVGVNLG